MIFWPKLRQLTRARLVFGFLLFAAELCHAQTSNGIFADFSTSMGSFTCRLDYALAPKAVANFIGLATGERAWVDVQTGKSSTNQFYDGVTFHRVIPDFMIQGGSPNGVGTDGPGYTFQDEFSPSAVFTNFGVLAMANAGPDSNGSQFFVTVGPATHLNGLHTIFGRLTGGSNVVYNISRAPRDANNKPYTNVVIESLRIRRVGTAAQAFNIHTNRLPVVTNLLLTVALNSATNVSLAFSNRLHAENWLSSSTNLLSWSPQHIGIETVSPITNTVFVPSTAPAQFFTGSQVQYASTKPAPKSLAGRTLIHSITNASSKPTTITNFFDLAGKGTYAVDTNRGDILQLAYEQQAYRGRLRTIRYSGMVPMQLHLDFSTPTNGGFTGTAYTGIFQQPTPISGKFWLK